MKYLIFSQISMYHYISLTICLMSHLAHVNTEHAVLVKPIEPSSSFLVPRIVLTLDVSGSMESQKRIYKLYDALRHWIKYQIPDGLKLAMVEFSSSSTLLSNLVVVNENSREKLIQNIPKLAQGETCISCGLALAMEVLGMKTTGSVIILITDVEESEPSQDVKDMFGKIAEMDIRVVTISIGNEILDYIEQLSTISRGQAYSIPDGETVYSDIINALNDTLQIFYVNEITTIIIGAESAEAETIISALETEIMNLTTETLTIPTTTHSKEVQEIMNLSSLPVLSSTLSSKNVVKTIHITDYNQEKGKASYVGLPAWAFGIIGGFSVIILLITILVVAAICLRKRYRIINIQGSYQLSKLINK